MHFQLLEEELENVVQDLHTTCACENQLNQGPDISYFTPRKP